MKKILYISTSFFRNESASIRNISLVNGLVENNIGIDILTLDFDENLEDKFLLECIDERIQIKKIPIYKFNKIFKNLKKINKNKKKESFIKKIVLTLKNVLKEILFFPDVFCEGIKESKKIYLEKNYDFIISSSDSKTSHFIAEEIIRKNFLNKVKWVQIWGDPWANDIGLKNKNFILKKRIEFNERELLFKADKIFYLSEITAKRIKDKYPILDKKINILGRSYLKKVVSKNSGDQFIFSYTGTISNRNLNPILEAIYNYNKLKDKKIILNFFGINEKEKREIKKYDFVKIYERVSFEKILEIYSKSDVLIYIDNLYNSSQIPGKIYDYFGTNKVILALTEGKETQKFLKKFERVEIYENNLEKIILEEVLNKIGKYEPLKNFSPKNVAKDFLNKIDNL